MYWGNVTLQRALFCWATANYFPISRTACQSCFVKSRFMAAWNLEFRVHFIKYPGTRHRERGCLSFMMIYMYDEHKGRRELVSLIYSSLMPSAHARLIERNEFVKAHLFFPAVSNGRKSMIQSYPVRITSINAPVISFNPRAMCESIVVHSGKKLFPFNIMNSEKSRKNKVKVA